MKRREIRNGAKDAKGSPTCRSAVVAELGTTLVDVGGAGIEANAFAASSIIHDSIATFKNTSSSLYA
jgi:hypothetical protein